MKNLKNRLILAAAAAVSAFVPVAPATCAKRDDNGIPETIPDTDAVITEDGSAVQSVKSMGRILQLEQSTFDAVASVNPFGIEMGPPQKAGIPINRPASRRNYDDLTIPTAPAKTPDSQKIDFEPSLEMPPANYNPATGFTL